MAGGPLGLRAAELPEPGRLCNVTGVWGEAAEEHKKNWAPTTAGLH